MKEDDPVEHSLITSRQNLLAERGNVFFMTGFTAYQMEQLQASQAVALQVTDKR